MAMSATRMSHVPLRRSISDFEVRRIRACRKAVSIACDAKRAREGHGRQPAQPTGYERWVETEDGRVGGYIDQVKVTGRGVVLSDYKSGSLLDCGTDGKTRKVKQAYRDQLELYAALYRHTCGIWPAALEIIPLQGTPVEIPLDKRQAKRLLETARQSFHAANKMIEEVENGNRDVTSLASPRAEHCRLCLFRPECRAYWTARREDPRQKWPFDLRGFLSRKIVLRNGKLCLMITKESSSALTVSIRNVERSEDRHPLLRSIRTGRPVEVYGLKYLPRSGDYLETRNTVMYQTDCR